MSKFMFMVDWHSILTSDLHWSTSFKISCTFRNAFVSIICPFSVSISSRFPSRPAITSVSLFWSRSKFAPLVLYFDSISDFIFWNSLSTFEMILSCMSSVSSIKSSLCFPSSAIFRSIWDTAVDNPVLKLLTLSYNASISVEGTALQASSMLSTGQRLCCNGKHKLHMSCLWLPQN